MVPGSDLGAPSRQFIVDPVTIQVEALAAEDGSVLHHLQSLSRDQFIEIRVNRLSSLRLKQYLFTEL